MRSRTQSVPLLALLALGAATTAGAEEGAAKITFMDQVSPIFRNHCGSCHNPDTAKGGLNLETFGGTMQGGGSGAVVEPGDPDSSTLLAVILHTEEPKMPPNSARIPDAEIEVIKKWIEGGALESSGSKVAAKAKPKMELKLDPNALGKPAGEPAMPENLAVEPFTPEARPGAVVALAASPWAPLLAVGGHKQVLLYRTTDQHLMGVLPFPEGPIHVLKFSRGGDVLLVGGGRGGQSGIAVGFDVKTGERVFEVGREYDAVLAADVSPDQGQVALGGPGRIVRVYSTADGSPLYEIKKHTEWITALEFSPDGVLLATGDRNNGLLVWEAETGREYLELRGHTGSITDVSWRLDSNVLASSSEDGTFATDGRLATAGRDRVVRIWDANGGKQTELEPFGDLALAVALTHDESAVAGSDWSGAIRLWDVKDGRRLASLTPAPAPIAVRIDLAQKELAAVTAEAEALTKELPALQA
ncbi:hypothetical protein HK102_010091, partial [Quaeritorhiza haematococci]